MNDNKPLPDEDFDWVANPSAPFDRESAAQLVARFMIALAYTHERIKIHVMLHPIFFLAGFVVAYFLF